MAALKINEYLSKPKKLELDVKHRKTPPVRPSIVEAPKFELKSLPPHLRYVFLGGDGTLSVIIAADLKGATSRVLSDNVEEVQASYWMN